VDDEDGGLTRISSERRARAADQRPAQNASVTSTSTKVISNTVATARSLRRLTEAIRGSTPPAVHSPILGTTADPAVAPRLSPMGFGFETTADDAPRAKADQSRDRTAGVIRNRTHRGIRRKGLSLLRQ
jgi:hypothetical protein